MEDKQVGVPSIVDQLFQNFSSAEAPADETRGVESEPQPSRTRHKARPLQLPRDRLAVTLEKRREAASISLQKLAEVSGVDVAHIWRIKQGEHANVSREVLILLSMGMVLDSRTVDQVVEIANEILDAAGLKMLRAPWEHGSQQNHPENHRK